MNGPPLAEKKAKAVVDSQAKPNENAAGRQAAAGPVFRQGATPTLPKPTIAKVKKDRTTVTRSATEPGAPSFLKQRAALPIWDHREAIRRALREEDVLILVGEPGSGKSTQVPQFLRTETWCRGMIAITEPRRVAATTLAHRVAGEAGTPLGNGFTGEVGYSVRFEHNVPRGTKIKFLTEGMLLQELLRDPGLEQYSCVIVDEVHERSVDADLLLGFLKQIQTVGRESRGGVPLKVVVMSATADVEKLEGFFSGGADDPKVRVLQIPGRQHPVGIAHTPEPVPDTQDALIKTIFKINKQEPSGDILAFLIGQEEIESAQRLIEQEAKALPSNVPSVVVFPLFGQMSIEAQHQAFQPVREANTRKVVLATNIAETSVTVPGVKYVVDCGWVKVKQFRSRLGMESLLAKPISKSSAIQRTGRAGREGPGQCYRLYTEESYDKDLREIDLPEMLRTDVLGAVLTMKARGIDDILAFPLMDMPDTESIEKALDHLWRLGALRESDGAITEIGRKMSLFPVSAPFARVLLAAADPQYDCLLEAIDIISCITAGYDLFLQVQSEEEREEVEEFRKELYRREGDLLTYLTTMQSYTSENANRIDWCRARKINIRTMKQALNIRKQLRAMCLKDGMLASKPPPDPQPFEPYSPDRAETLIRCFMEGFAMRTARLAPDGTYVTTPAQGKQAVAIHPSSVLYGQSFKREAIMFLEYVYTSKNYAKKVSAVQLDWIVEAYKKWDAGDEGSGAT